MGLPIQVRTDRPWLIELVRVPVLGPLALCGLTLAPALVALALFCVWWLVAFVGGIHSALTSDHAMAIGLLASAPWNLGLAIRRIRVKLLWVPAWIFCVVMGAFGLAKACGNIP